VNNELQKGHPDGLDKSEATKTAFIGAAALMLPSLLPGLSSGLQFLAPGVAACFLDYLEDFRVKASLLGGVFLLGGVILLLLGKPEAMLLLAQSFAIAAILLIASWAGRPAPETLLSCSLCLAVLSGTILFLATGGRPHKAYDTVIQEVATEFDQGVEIYKKNAGEQVPPQLNEIMGQVKETMITYFPAIIGLIFIFLSLTNIYAFTMCAKVRRNQHVIGPEFQRWKMPPWLIWAFIVSGFMAIYPEDKMAILGKNAVTVVSVFYLIQGFAVMKFFFQTMKTPAFVRWLVYLLIGIQWYGLLMIIFTGLMDNWFDFRQRLEKNRKGLEE